MRGAERTQAALAGHRHDEAGARHFTADTDPVVRATALGALARMDRLSADDVRAGLADPDAVVRRRAAELAVRAPEVRLVEMLDDPDHLVVEAACWAMGERSDHDGVLALARTSTGHEDPLCREAAVAALGAIGDGDGLAAILAATTDKPAIRRRAVLALAAFEGPEVDAALRRALEDRDWQVRQAAEDLGATGANP